MNQEHPLSEVGFKQAEEPEVKLPTFLDCEESKGVLEKKSTFASLTLLKALIVWITENCGTF